MVFDIFENSSDFGWYNNTNVVCALRQSIRSQMMMSSKALEKRKGLKLMDLILLGHRVKKEPCILYQGIEYSTISTGNILREVVKNGTEYGLGKEAMGEHYWMMLLSEF